MELRAEEKDTSEKNRVNWQNREQKRVETEFL